MRLFGVEDDLTLIASARLPAELYAIDERWQDACDLLTKAVDPLPEVSPRSLGRDDQQAILSHLNRLSEEAASMALLAGEGPMEALRVLEISRGVMLGFSIDFRSEFAELREAHPDHFRRFDQLRTMIDSFSSVSGSRAKGTA